MSLMTEQRTPTDVELASSFERMKDKGAPALRQAAWSNFSRTGLPNRRVESWHYTDLRATLRTVAPLAEGSTGAPAVERRNEELRLVTLDGVFRADLSDVQQDDPQDG